MEEYGTYLRDLRLQKGLSVEKVSEGTKIVVEVIHALESMNKEKFPSQVHLIGFIKLYARYLEANPDDVVAMFKTNVASETTLNFDVINITKKKKINKKLVIILCCIAMVLIGGGLIFIFFPKIQSFAKSLYQKKLEATNNEQLAIESIYESVFSIKKSFTLNKNSLRANGFVSSISPPVITVNNNEYLLQKNTPVHIDMGNDVRYSVILRDVKLATNSLLLRFDPHELPIVPEKTILSVNSDIETYIQQADGKVIEILTSSTTTPIEVVLQNNLPVKYYYKYETQEDTREGMFVRTVSITADEYVTVYISNAALIDITVNKVAVSKRSENLPLVLHIAWEQTNSEHRLLAVPLP